MGFSAETEAALAAVAAHLAGAGRVLFITGAGISADSGLPTYRGIGGLYNGQATEDGLRIEDALSGEVFAQRPDITWKYLAQIEHNCRDAGPNGAHYAIARLEEERPGVLVLTQNVDGLHRRAGSRNVIEIHGDLHHLACTACDWRATVDSLEGWPIPPTCPECGEVVRPQVVLFGEALPMAAVTRLYDELDRGFDLVFSIGTSSIFPYIAQPVVWAAQAGIPTVEINPARTVLSDIVEYRLPLGAAAAMEAIMERLGKQGRVPGR
ncbi:MAG TPA: NAD-dependent deacylase [Rhodocyclaceae bacterium]|nr:NAD-dependent deacylase [Rhodocyclaceae bacterium]